MKKEIFPSDKTFLQRTKTYERLSPEKEQAILSKRRKATDKEIEECFNRSEDPRLFIKII